MKQLLKKGITALTAICLATGVLQVLAPTGVAEAAEDLENWTYATAGITDGNKTYEEKSPLVDEQGFELGGSKFSGYVTFSHANADNKATTDQWNNAPRLSFGAEGESDRNCWINKSIKFGLVTYNENTYLGGGMDNENGWIFLDCPMAADTEFFFQVAFEYVAKDSDNIANDLQLHVWVNGKKVSSALQTWGSWNTVTGDDLSIKNYVEDTNPVMAHVMLYAQGTNQKISVRSAYGIDVTGIENNKKYCDAVTVSLKTNAPDSNIEKDLARVMVGDVAQNVINGSFTIPAGAGEKIIQITDKTGITQTYTITVNNGHNWGSEYVSNHDATCKMDGTKSPVCSVCGAVNDSESAKMKDEGSKLEHIFETYVSDNDATCAQDGHETASCKYGCGTTDTRVVSGSATGNHTYGDDGKCTTCGVKKTEAKADDAGTNRQTTGSPKTGDIALIYGLLVVALLSAVVVIYFIKKMRMEQLQR